MSGETHERVPPHLRRFVVQQDYAAYTEVDQAVWRFVLLQMYDRLEREAHPAYARGLTQSGMSVERIPRIDAMDTCLRGFGWGAVCVDGFIPPRAFQEFQALGILPIAAAIRTVEHLPYTPAPDIIHEAAGHAPILPDPEYAAFLRRIGECGMRAFASRRDGELYAAIYRLSVVKEQRDAGAAAVAEAERVLSELVAQPAVASEATRLARLYWWSVEYGLIGDTRAPKLYGAGLLSSLAESYFCHDPGVRKIPLTRACADVDYDITRPQPQLFVARDFAHLGEVLDDVCASMAFRSGGLDGLMVARVADEVATLEFDNGLQLTGSVGDVVADERAPCFVALHGACAIGHRDRILEGHGRASHPAGMGVVFGVLADGTDPSALAVEVLARRYPASASDRVRLPIAGGIEVEGRLEAAAVENGSLGECVVLSRANVSRGAQLLFAEPDARVIIVGPRTLTSVRAGAADPSYWPAAEYLQQSSPVREPESPKQAALRALYERAARAIEHEACSHEHSIAAVHAALQREHPQEWLLRWNLLESLRRLDLDPARRASLVRELWRLEHALHGRYPIAMGLRYLAFPDPGVRGGRE